MHTYNLQQFKDYKRKTVKGHSKSLVQNDSVTMHVILLTNFRHAHNLTTWSTNLLRHLSSHNLVPESPRWRNTSSACSQLITPAAKQFLRDPKDWSLKAPHLDYVVNVVTLPIHISRTTVWSSGLCEMSHFHREWATPPSFFKQHLSGHPECCSSINCLISGAKPGPLKNSFVASVIYWLHLMHTSWIRAVMH
jgi:hypothetical protein